MIKRSRLSLAMLSAAAAAAASPALAQDVGDWTGFYLGANLGASWGDTSTKTSANPGGGAIIIPPADLAAINAAGADSSNKTNFTGGIEGGYNYQMGALLIGIETDWGFFDVSQRKTRTFNSGLLIAPPIQVTIDQNLKTDWIWTLRPRIGYVGGPWMVYGTGGIATTKIKYSMNYSDTASNVTGFEAKDTKTGWTAGVGGAYQFTPQLSVKAEYLYADFGHIRGSAPVSTGGYVDFTSDAKVKANILRMGVDYRF